MIRAPIRRSASRVAAGLLVAAASLAVVALAPIRTYKPSCGRPYPLLGRPAIEGPLRSDYVEMLTRAMRRENFRYWRLRDTVLVPLWPVFDGNRVFQNWDEFTLNTEWRIARSIVNGYTAHGCAPPPEAVRRLYGSIEQSCGWPVERTPDGRRIPPPEFWLVDDCALFRAAVIRVEAMPQPLFTPKGASQGEPAAPPRPGPEPQRL